ncbi:hypothetical protein V1282_005195 [Nitrobacteraceae bacterium AZCC 2146]
MRLARQRGFSAIRGGCSGAAIAVRGWYRRASHQHGDGTEKLAALRKFSRNALGVQDGGFPIGAIESDPVRKQAVSVDDMKEVSHRRPISIGERQLPVTNA